MEKMAHGLQRMGRADGGGFYEYDDDEVDEGGDRELWSGLKAFVRRGVALPMADIEDRLRFAPVLALLQAVARLNSKDAGDSATGQPALHSDHDVRHQAQSPCAGPNDLDTKDVAKAAATNSQLWPHGHAPFSLIETLGETAFITRANDLQTRYGQRFALPTGWDARH